MHTLKQQILAAAKADSIPAGESGLWYVKKCVLEKPVLCVHEGKLKGVPPGNYTYLLRWTDATMHLDEGECVMHDTPDELVTHLEFMLKAHGRVLISGLGLGCVVRGCLANPRVTHVTVIELSQDVLKLVHRHMPQDPRLVVIRDDALKWTKRYGNGFDCAWHDLWLEPEDRHLQEAHMDLVCALADKVRFQGAWAFPRYFRRRMQSEPFQML